MENTQGKGETFESLSKVKYGDLKSKFTDLGIEGVWKPGKKANELIKSALDKLAEISGKKAEEAEIALVQEEKEKEELLPKAELETLIAKLKRASGVAIASHKKGLLVRLETFEKMLTNGDYLK